MENLGSSSPVCRSFDRGRSRAGRNTTQYTSHSRLLSQFPCRLGLTAGMCTIDHGAGYGVAFFVFLALVDAVGGDDGLRGLHDTFFFMRMSLLFAAAAEEVDGLHLEAGVFPL